MMQLKQQVTSSGFNGLSNSIRFAKEPLCNLLGHTMGTKGQWIALSMDRTNWKFGKININFLTIGISWRGTAIPLVWMMLDKRGLSSQHERIYLLEQLLQYLNNDQKKRIRYLLMDREFAAEKWLTYLKKQSFHFIIRIRKDARIRKPGILKDKAVYLLFKGRHFKALSNERILFNHRLFVGGQKLSNTEYLILISDVRLTHGTQMCTQRWGIEVFFGCTKKRGFNFESTHLNKLDRINTLAYILAIAFVWSLIIGEYLIDQGHQIPIKKVKHRKSKLYRIFRIGLDYIKRKLLNFLSLYYEIGLLSCT